MWCRRRLTAGEKCDSALSPPVSRPASVIDRGAPATAAISAGWARATSPTPARHFDTKLLTGRDVESIVHSRVDTGDACFCDDRVHRRLRRREQPRYHRCASRRCATVCRRVRGEVGTSDRGGDRGIGLVRSVVPVGMLGVPAADGRVHDGHVHQRVHASRPALVHHRGYGVTAPIGIWEHAAQTRVTCATRTPFMCVCPE